MWDFIFGPDGIRSQRINLLWVGLNPNFYHHLLKEEEHTLNNLQISEICDKIWSSVTNLRLNVVSNLLKGACIVHKAQVDCLYSKTRNLFCYQKSNSLDISSFNKFSEESYTFDWSESPKKRKIPKKNSDIFYDENLLEETENINQTDENDVLISNGINLTSLEADITLKETDNKNCNYIASKDDEELSELGELTNNEKINFLEILDIQKKDKKKFLNKNNLKILDTSILTTKEHDEYSFDIPRFKKPSDNISLGEMQIDQIFFDENEFVDQNNNLEISNLNKITDQENVNNDDCLDQFVIPENNIILPDYHTFIANIVDKNKSETIKRNPLIKRPLEENLENVDKKRRKILKIDKAIEFTAQQIISQIQNTSVFRCICPRQDVVPKHKFDLHSSDHLISSPNLKLPLPLMVYFKRNLKRKKVLDDPSILNDILNKEEIPYICAENFEIKKRKSNSKNTLFSNELFLNENIVELQNIIPLNSIEEQIITKNDNVKTFSRNEDIIEQIAKSIEFLENSHNLNQDECSIIFKHIKNNWNQSSILRKLSHLWNLNDKQVTMELLCKNVTKQAAAVAFSSIIQLSAKRYINLIKEENTNTILNIEMGENIINKL